MSAGGDGPGRCGYDGVVGRHPRLLGDRDGRGWQSVGDARPNARRSHRYHRACRPWDQLPRSLAGTPQFQIAATEAGAALQCRVDCSELDRVRRPRMPASPRVLTSSRRAPWMPPATWERPRATSGCRGTSHAAGVPADDHIADDHAAAPVISFAVSRQRLGAVLRRGLQVRLGVLAAVPDDAGPHARPEGCGAPDRSRKRQGTDETEAVRCDAHWLGARARARDADPDGLGSDAATVTRKIAIKR